MLPLPSVLYDRITMHGLFVAGDDFSFFSPFENVKLQNIHNVVLNVTCTLAMESVQVRSIKRRGVRQRKKRVILVAAKPCGFSLQSN